MYSIISGACIVVIFSGITIAASNYPSDLPKCHTGDNKCITDVVKLFTRNYTDGIPAINVPPLDPLLLGKFDMIRENKESILSIPSSMTHLDWRNYNLKFYGMKNATITITGFEKNLNDSNVIISIFLPNATYTADYNLNVTFMQRHTYGQGKFRFEFKNFEFHWNFKLRLYEKDDGKQYMSIDQPNADYAFTSISDLNFGTLFNGNEILSRLEHIILNKNGRLFIENLRREAGPELARVFTLIVEPIFSQLPIDQMFIID